MKRVLTNSVLFILMMVCAAAVVYIATVRSVERRLPIAASVDFTIAAHSSFARVAGELSRSGIVPDPKLWVLYARYQGFAGQIKAGEYRLTPGATPRSVLQQFVEGRILLHPFTIVEGWRTADLLDALRHNPLLRTTREVQASDPMDRLGSPTLSAEGQFLPETYQLPRGATDLELLTLAHAALVKELNANWAQHAADLPLKNPVELLTLASIVEKETALPSEREKIAGVYAQRLIIGMRLQADPTVIYGLGERYDGMIHIDDLRTDGPYNTYTRAGLPPTPICLPGSASIRAAAHPKITGAIFFVASGLGDGSHTFTSNLKDHNAAVETFLKRQRARAASSSQ